MANTESDSHPSTPPPGRWPWWRRGLAWARDRLGLGPKQLIAGRYQVKTELPPSGMGQVFKAWDVSKAQWVALKQPRAGASQERFRREANLANIARDPSILTPLDVGFPVGGSPYFTTRWIDGCNLAEYLRRRPTLSDRLAVYRRCLQLVCTVHDYGLAHRDIKPGNFMVGDDGNVYLLDFGLVHLPGEATLTGSGAVMGTPGYMAPELSGREHDSADPRQADVYSLTAVMWELLVGEIGGGRSGDLSARLSWGDRRFDLLARAGLAADPRARPLTAAGFLAWYDLCQKATDPQTPVPPPEGLAPLPPPTPGTRPSPRPRRTPWWARLLKAAALLVPLAGSAWYAYSVLPDEERQKILLWWEQRMPAVAAEKVSTIIPIPPVTTNMASCVLTLLVTPAGANVVLEDSLGRIQEFTSTGAEPLAATLPVGHYTATATLKNHRQAVVPLDLNRESATLEISLPRRRGDLEIHGPHSGARIFATGADRARRELGQTDAQGRLTEKSLLEGRYQIEAVLPNHAPFTAVVELEQDKPRRVDLMLKPLPGRLKVIGHDAIRVHAGEKQLGAANDWIADLPAGPLGVELRRPGFRPVQLATTIPANGDKLEKAPAMALESGRLKITASVPSEAVEYFRTAAARLVVDGGDSQSIRFPHEVEEVVCGERRVAVLVEGFAPPADQRVKVLDRQTTEVRFDLRPAPVTLVVSTQPASSAEILLGDQVVGRAGAAISVPVFTTLRLTARTQDQAGEIELQPLLPGKSYTCDIPLRDAPRLAASLTDSQGMKYAPVPITGGPSAGKVVLFSIWETRVQDYAAFANENPGTDTSWRSPGFAQGNDHPVVNVSWHDAVAFSAWKTKKERAAGRIGPRDVIRLPTDHEWSCAVGIGDREKATDSPQAKDEKIKGVYPWGNNWPPPKGVANLRSSLGLDNFPNTSPVGSFPANALGLFDLSGNVWEWLQDQWSSTSRVLRGGSWSVGHGDALLSSAAATTPLTFATTSLAFAWC
jgi:serine/threonine protein kinase